MLGIKRNGCSVFNLQNHFGSDPTDNVGEAEVHFASLVDMQQQHDAVMAYSLTKLPELAQQQGFDSGF